MIALLQEIFPHYRLSFFKNLNESVAVDFYKFKNINDQGIKGINTSFLEVNGIFSLSLGPIIYYNFFPFLKSKYSTLVLMLHRRHISTFILLFTKKVHKKKMVLWGHGISIKNYKTEALQPNWIFKIMISKADVVWLYTQSEVEIWKKIFPSKNIIAINNTISNIEEIIDMPEVLDIDELKAKYGIYQEFCFIYCARFNTPHRRIDLLVEIIESLDSSQYAFIIIGEGELKPDFSIYNNVLDFGAVYDITLKKSLFSIADAYIQPGWVGLSVVEAMAYGKSVITFQRRKDIHQCVEYSYLQDSYNAIIYKNIDLLLKDLPNRNKLEFKKLGMNAFDYAKNNLSISNMVQSAVHTIG